MPEENKTPEVDTPIEVSAEEEEKALIEAEEKVALNKKISSIVARYFKALATLTEEEIYDMKYTEDGQESLRLLEVVNGAYAEMMEVGGDLPCGHFDHYKQVVADFNNTLVFQIGAKLDSNRDTLVAIATGKTEEPERISHKDIVDALDKE
jgi:hypothetical protein